MSRWVASLFTVVLLGVLPVKVIVAADSTASQPGEVAVVAEDGGGYELRRDGAPYVVKGAGGAENLPLLAASGGNSVRTWHFTQLEEKVDGKPFLDHAHELGLSVVVGIWIGHKRHGFDYGDKRDLERQREMLREGVLKYKDHPAVLMWGLGNEMEAFQQGGTDVRIWKELEYLASMINELDGQHPIMSAVSGVVPEAIKGIHEHYPSLDILGVNAYGAGAGVGQSLLRAGWDGPYMLTEFGVDGWWEVPTTSWGAQIEPDPSTKAAQYYATYTTDRDDNTGRSLGSYAFLWGQKQEATSTWFGMFLDSGEKLPVVDAMAFAWTGEWPKNRAPKIRSLETPAARQRVEAGELIAATVDAVDREGDALEILWEVREESSDRRIGGDEETKPPALPHAIKTGQGMAEIEFEAPQRSGAYRLFVTLFDGNGGAAAHNVPFYVE